MRFTRPVFSRHSLWYPVFLFFIFAGCAAHGPGSGAPGKPAEAAGQQLDAARKVMGAMAGHDVSREEFGRVARDIRQNEETRTAVGRIIGPGPGAPVVKYSPRTGKHYNGDLEFDPETGEKLEVLPE